MGVRPFSGETPLATMEAIRAGAAQLAGLADDVADVVRCALAPDAARFVSTDAFRAALDELVVQRQ